MRNRDPSIGPWLLTLLLLGTTAAAQGAERIVYGRVLEAVPLPAEGAQENCSAPRPPGAEDGLAAMLRFELVELPAADRLCDRRRLESIAGYRVRYEWNGREFEDILPERPSRTIPLRLHID
jgi:hypothetical protein